MKFFYKLMFVGLAGVLAVPMVIKGSDGQPLMSWRDWLPSNMGAPLQQAKQLASSFSSDQEDGKSASVQSYYKWRNQDGVWQMTQVPPQPGEALEVEMKQVDASANVIQSLDQAKIKQTLSGSQERRKFVGRQVARADSSQSDISQFEDSKAIDVETLSDVDGLIPGVSTFSKIPALLQGAQSIEGLGSERKAAMDRALQQ